MDSPETDRIPPSPSQSPAFEDSPFTNFMCTLSPIKPSKRAHVGRLFSEINLPPPTPVFTSPRINPQRETCFLKRPQYLALTDAELSLEYDDRGKMLAVGLDVSQPSASQPTAVLNPCTLESCEKENSLQVDPCSPSESVDAFLADPLEDCANATDSPDLLSEKSKTTDPPQLLQSDCNSSKETISESVDREGDDIQEDTQSKVAEKASLSEHAKEDLVCTKPVDHVKSLDTKDNLKPASRAKEKDNQKLCTELQCSASTNVETGPLRESAFGEGHGSHMTISDSASLLSIDKEHENVESEKEMPTNSSDLCEHGTQDVKMHLVDGGQKDKRSHTVEVLPGSSLNVQVDVILHDSIAFNTTTIAFNTTTDNQASHEFEEASQHQFGMRRRLQFESSVNHRKNAWGSNIRNAPNSVFNAMSPASPSNAESKMACTSKQAVNLSGDALPRSTFQPFKTLQPPINKVDSSARSSGNSPTTTPLPSSIGLHLNSIGNTIAASSRIKSQFAEKDSLNVKVEKPLSGSSSHLLQDSMGCPVPASLAGNSLSRLTAKVDSFLPSVEGNDVEQQENLDSAMASPLTSFQNSAQNVKTLSNSLQLKLTGQQGTPCENKMPAQDTSMFEELNQMSPKKKRKRDSYSEDVGCKRCNCKKSKCLKLYCDCFAAGVYCAEPCACQDCFNKPEYEDTVLGTRQQIESRNPLAFAPKIVLRASDSPLINDGNGHLTTPASARHKRGCNCKKSRCLKKYCECYQAAVGCSAGCRCEGCKNIFGKKDGCGEIMEMEHRKAADERWHEVSDRKLVLEVKSHLEKSCADSLSPLTPLHQCSEKSPRSPRNSEGSRSVTAKELNVGPVSHDHELDCHKAGEVNPFSSRWDGLARISGIGSFEQHPHSRATASSVIDVRHNSKDMQARLCGGGVCLSVSPLRWNGSPVTPTTHFRGSKFTMDADSDNRLYNIPEDDTPDILKETHSPIKAVKASSPNQKRVSPPHNCLHESKRSSSSPGLRSGRKFILQSVPSFPPLTPYSDPKGSEK